MEGVIPVFDIEISQRRDFNQDQLLQSNQEFALFCPNVSLHGSLGIFSGGGESNCFFLLPLLTHQLVQLYIQDLNGKPLLKLYKAASLKSDRTIYSSNSIRKKNHKGELLLRHTTGDISFI